MRKLLLAGLFCLSFIGLSEAQPIQSPATILYVKDGDTFRAKVEVWPNMFWETDVRVAHIDTPETKRGSQCKEERKAGRKAASFAKTLLSHGDKVTLSSIRQGKYAGRIIAKVTLSDGRDYGTIMLKKQHAIPYEGSIKNKIWCD